MNQKNKSVNIVAFASGSGSNFKSIHHNIKIGKINAEIKLLVSNNPKADVLAYANAEEIPIFIQSGDKQEQKDSLVVGIRTSKFKYYRDRKNPKENVHLYDLQKDPLEKNNIVSLFPQIIKSMEKILLQYEKVQPITKIEENDDETKKIEDELKKMGYL